MQPANLLINQRVFTAVVTSSFKVHSVNVPSIFWLNYLFTLNLCYFKLKRQRIDRNLVFSGVSLEEWCQETLREEETTDPVSIRSGFWPWVQELHSFLEVDKPASQGFESFVAVLSPETRDSVFLKGWDHFVKVLVHRDGALDSFFEHFEGFFDNFEEKVELFDFLEKEVCHWGEELFALTLEVLRKRCDNDTLW